VYLGVIWIVSLRSVLVFFTIDDKEVIIFCLFKFNFLGTQLILLFNIF
jgi:hypothetical protein